MKMNAMSRRSFGRLITMALVTAAMLTASVAARAADEVRVLNWQGYGTDEPWAVELFEERTGIKIVHDYFNSEQEMLTKLRTSPGAYDVVLINSAFTGDAAREGLIEPLDSSKIGNFDDLNKTFRDHDYFMHDGALYGLAWLWGVTSFAYNTNVISEPLDSIEVLWDAAHAGRVAWRDDSVEAVSLAAIATGQDMNNPPDLAAIREKLRALKPQIKTFWSSEDEWNKLFDSGAFDIAVYWSGSAARSKKAFGLPVSFVIPKEGAIGWFDGLSVAKDAPNRDAAHAFIDFMVDPEFYVRWDNEVGAPASSNTVAIQQLPDDAFNRVVMGDPAVADRLQFMAPLSDEQRQTFLEIWEETKTYYAK